MDPVEPVIELFRGVDGLLEHHELTWWGGVATDGRYPTIWDNNYARVEVADAALSLQEIEASLLPALIRSGARHEHLVLFRPGGCRRLLQDLDRAGGQINWDSVMRLEGPLQGEPGAHVVEEVRDLDAAFWQVQRRAMQILAVTTEDALDQLVAWERDLMAPFGKRWFRVRGRDGDDAAFGAFLLVSAVAYIDNVVTFEPYRRQGMAAAVVTRMVELALEAGAGQVLLLADEPGPIHLYRRLGFRVVHELASWLRDPR